jgi:hypothetical protein
MPFYRPKVKLKKEIVTMGVEDINPRHIVGTYVRPEDWNALISDPAVTVIDTRNEYEIQIGSFAGATNPHTTTFREFPAYAGKNLDKSVHSCPGSYLHKQETRERWWCADWWHRQNCQSGFRIRCGYQSLSQPDH